jgi:secretory carrier-associated membrane protein
MLPQSGVKGKPTGASDQLLTRRSPSNSSMTHLTFKISFLSFSSLDLHLQRRQEELERKAAELERREAELLRNSNTAGVRRNNWPPLPDKFCVQPCFYHDISIDIPSEFQKIVQQLYYLWIFYAGLMACNVIGAMLLMFVNGNFSTFFLSIFYCLLFTPAAFLCW